MKILNDGKVFKLELWFGHSPTPFGINLFARYDAISSCFTMLSVDCRYCCAAPSLGQTCLESSLRLGEDRSSLNGTVQVCLNGNWSSVCASSSSWNITAATVVCRQLGHSQEGIYSLFFKLS